MSLSLVAGVLDANTWQVKCVVPENIHTTPTEGLEVPARRGVSKIHNFFSLYFKINYYMI